MLSLFGAFVINVFIPWLNCAAHRSLFIKSDLGISFLWRRPVVPQCLFLRFFPMFLFSFPTLYYLGVHLNLIFLCMLSQHHPKPKVRPGLSNSIYICVFVVVHLYLCICICVFIVVYLLLYNWTCRRRYKYTTLLSCLPPFFQIAVTLWNPLTRNTNYSCSPPVPFWQRNYFDLMWNRKLYVAINKDWKAIRWLTGIDRWLRSVFSDLIGFWRVTS